MQALRDCDISRLSGPASYSASEIEEGEGRIRRMKGGWKLVGAAVERLVTRRT
jgi:hypothetical protein